MNARCNPTGNVQRKHKSYVGVSHEFKSFQHFADWASCQVGYDNDGFQLDKDILYKGCKVYSESTCVFIPQALNKFIVNAAAARGKYPVGVCLHKRDKIFEAYCNDEDNNRVYLGRFCCPIEAFQAHKRFKESVAKILADKWKSQVDPRVYDALMNFTVEITD